MTKKICRYMDKCWFKKSGMCLFRHVEDEECAFQLNCDDRHCARIHYDHYPCKIWKKFEGFEFFIASRDIMSDKDDLCLGIGGYIEFSDEVMPLLANISSERVNRAEILLSASADKFFVRENHPDIVHIRLKYDESIIRVTSLYIDRVDGIPILKRER